MSGTTTTDTDTDQPAADTPEAILRAHLDDHDYQIFEALNEDGRMSDTELADRVGLSRTAVRRRRENLTDSGILEILAVIVLQEADLAYADVRVSVDQSVDRTERDELIERLIDAELVYSVDSCLGDYDLFVRTWHSTLNDVKSYVWDLLDDDPAVDAYDITPVVKTWKAWNRKLDRPTED
ncbi:Lrp/AsnC family transcriptional regulator [Halobaculum sp. EA56]|uniref:Lrp/AsnC family transcriptional regulator n=1 Tax=Halobaculum sp. EA56 TaxID=3421648 RepID=UPI003EB6DA64